MKIEIKTDFYTIKIYFDGLIHLVIKRDELISIHSWLCGGNKYCIEFITKTNKVIIEQDSYEKWETILKLLDKENLFC